MPVAKRSAPAKTSRALLCRHRGHKHRQIRREVEGQETSDARLLGVGQGSANKLLRLDDLHIRLPSVSLLRRRNEDRAHRVKLKTRELLLERREERLAEGGVGLRREEAVEESVLVELLRRQLLAEQEGPVKEL